MPKLAYAEQVEINGAEFVLSNCFVIFGRAGALDTVKETLARLVESAELRAERIGLGDGAEGGEDFVEIFSR